MESTKVIWNSTIVTYFCQTEHDILSFDSESMAQVTRKLLKRMAGVLTKNRDFSLRYSWKMENMCFLFYQCNKAFLHWFWVNGSNDLEAFADWILNLLAKMTILIKNINRKRDVHKNPIQQGVSRSTSQGRHSAWCEVKGYMTWKLLKEMLILLQI